jgi:hypothetical protein
MISYAGIGSRDISSKELEVILRLSKKLSERYICYSGNAPGADENWQRGSEGRCVIFLPWRDFNAESYPPSNSLAYFVVGNEPEGLESISKFHQNPQGLTRGGRALMARNYYQIMGYDKFPRVSFVVCCADFNAKGSILGGTGQACRIAKSLKIPIFNIRKPGFLEDLKSFLVELG